jgi:hypothetical protein
MRFRNLYVAVAIVITSIVNVPAFAQGVHEQGSWCLKGYQTGIEDCSFSNRDQCLGSAVGGLGGCELNVPTRSASPARSIASIRY